MRLMSFDRTEVLALEPEAGWSWRRERVVNAGLAWTTSDQGRWAPDEGGVLALFEHGGAPTLLVDHEPFVLDDPALVATVVDASPRRRFRLAHGPRVLREREYDAPAATPREEDSLLSPPSAADLDFAVFLVERLACPGLRRSFRGVDFGKNLWTAEKLGSLLADGRGRITGCARTGDELVLGRLRLSCRHPTARGLGGWSFEIGGACRLRVVPFERGLAVVLRLFDLSRSLDGAEEVLAGWVPEAEAGPLEEWLAPVEARLEEIRRAAE